MSRRGKSRVGGGPNQQTMLRAAEQGHAAVSHAQDQKLAQVQQGGRDVAGAVREAFGGVGGALQRSRQKSAGEAAAKQKQQNFETTTNLNAADKGLQRVSNSQAASAQGTTAQGEDPRMKQLQSEMDRGAKQTSKSIESVGVGRFEKSPERVASEKQAANTNNLKARTATLNAQTALQKSIAQNDGSAVAQDRIKTARARWTKQIDSHIAFIGKLNSGQVSKSELDDFYDTLKDHPDPKLQEATGINPDELKNRPDLIPRMIEAQKMRVGAEQIQLLAIDGDMTGLDDRLPIMRKFHQVRDSIAEFAAGNMEFAGLSQGAQASIEDQNPGIQKGADFANKYQAFEGWGEVTTYLNKTAAHIMINRQKLEAAARAHNRESGMGQNGQSNQNGAGPAGQGQGPAGQVPSNIPQIPRPQVPDPTPKPPTFN